MKDAMRRRPPCSSVGLPAHLIERAACIARQFGGRYGPTPRRRGRDPMEQPVVEFRKVTKRFGEVLAVDDNNLAAKAGEFLSILGPSGGGKTTSLRMIAGLPQPTTPS